MPGRHDLRRRWQALRRRRHSSRPQRGVRRRLDWRPETCLGFRPPRRRQSTPEFWRVPDPKDEEASRPVAAWVSPLRRWWMTASRGQDGRMNVKHNPPRYPFAAWFGSNSMKFESIAADLRTWLQESIERGCSRESVVQSMRAAGYQPKIARAAAATAFARFAPEANDDPGSTAVATQTALQPALKPAAAEAATAQPATAQPADGEVPSSSSEILAAS